MWLINVATLELEFFLPEQAPPYAILSHTWGDGEVSLAEFQRLDIKTTAKPGFSKVKKTCELARAAYLGHVWVDTCCIDKSSSAELSEAINSMFKWYQDAAVCYAFLQDWDPNTTWDQLDPNKPPRWFSRGWTLQELIAPKNVQFYDSTWAFRGTKTDGNVLPNLFGITRINQDILRDGSEDRLRGICLAQRMSWASLRETTRTEDVAYCLMGLFQVNMPLLYGEGNRAFTRLQEEIIKRSTDLSILAWLNISEPGERTTSDEILAFHPRQFRNHSSSSVRSTMFSPGESEMTMTNKGLRIEGQIRRREAAADTGPAKLVYLDTGCVSTNKNGSYTVFFVALGLEQEGHTNAYKRSFAFGDHISHINGSGALTRLPADLRAVYILRSQPHLLGHKILPRNFSLCYGDGSGRLDKYFPKFKDAWPPGTVSTDDAIRNPRPRVATVTHSLRLHHPHASMGYMVFEMWTKNSTEPLVDFLVVYKHKVGRDGDKPSTMWVGLALGEFAEDLKVQAAETEEMEPWPAEDSLSKCLKSGIDNCSLLDKLIFIHGNVEVQWRLGPVRLMEYDDRYTVQMETAYGTNGEDVDWKRGVVEREVITLWPP